MFEWEKLREQAVVAAFQVLLQHEIQKGGYELDNPNNSFLDVQTVSTVALDIANVFVEVLQETQNKNPFISDPRGAGPFKK